MVGNRLESRMRKEFLSFGCEHIELHKQLIIKHLSSVRLVKKNPPKPIKDQNHKQVEN